MDNSNQGVTRLPIKAKIFKFISAHKILLVIILLAIGGGTYYFLKSKTSSTATRYVLGETTKGLITTSVSGSGQVSASNQADVKPEVTAKIISISVKAGQTVKAGDVLAELDSQNLSRKVTDARNSLTIAQSNLALKLAGPTDQDLALAKKSVESAKAAYDLSVKNLEYVKSTAESNLNKALLSYSGGSTSSESQSLINTYEDAKQTINSALLNMRSAIVLSDRILGFNNYNDTTNSYKYLLGSRDSQTLANAKTSYGRAYASMVEFEKKYNAVINAGWTRSDEESLLQTTLQTVQDMKTLQSDVYKMLLNTSTSSQDLSQDSLDNLKSSTSSQESAMINAINSVQSAIQAINSAKVNTTSSQSSLEQTKSDNAKSIESATSDVNSKKNSYETAQIQLSAKTAKPRDVDIVATKIQISQAENTYQQALADLYSAKIVTPIDGVVAKIYQGIGDTANPDNNLISITTSKQMATISLNEVDTAKVKNGQKATLTFTAIDGLTITGTVSEIESIGTVTQGVVNYAVKIVFDTQDDRIKPQMSVSASIITSEAVDVLMVPNAAVKTDTDGTYYVETITDLGTQAINSTGVTSVAGPKNIKVEVGISNDTNTEITSGLNEGDKVIIRTITGTASTAAKSTSQTSGSSALRMLNGGGGGPGR